MNTTTATATLMPSYTCPAVQDKAPGAKHSLYRDIDMEGKDYWTTDCSHCGEIPLCGQHSFEYITMNINHETEYAAECQTCGFRYIATEQEYRVEMAHKVTLAAMAEGLPEPRVKVADLHDLGERPFKLYKILITEIPEACDSLRWVFDDDLQAHVRTRDWKPAGWTEYVYERILGGAKWDENQHFFWPSEEKTYRSRSAAADKVAIVERWGGKAIILEAEVSSFIPVTEANRRRQETRDRARAEKLRAKADQILAKHESPA